ncbi:hypothetical protein FRC03_001829 [Tulasnella sp. 419]|nr:hypothetical protein FRC03_001829 [Tulasnella sp. 419]
MLFFIILAVALFLWTCVKVLGRLLHRRLRRQLTILDDLPNLGTTQPNKILGCAVVCGGSVSGLLAARVCSDHFSEVIVVEPESLFDDSGAPHAVDFKRKRVLQYTALHGFQPVNLKVLRQLFPTFDEAVKAVGARVQPTEYNTHVSGIRIPSPENPEETVYISRAAYETVLRQLTVSACPNIKFLNGTVVGVNASSFDDTKIGSVSVRMNGIANPHVIPAALVIDSTGHSLAAGPKWLERAGFGAPKEGETLGKDQLHIRDVRITYDPKMRYVCQSFRVRPEIQESLPIPGGYKRAGFLYSNFSDPTMDNKTVLITWSDPDKLSFAIGGWDLQEKPRGTEELKIVLRSINTSEPIPQWVYDLIDMVAEDAVPEWDIDVRVPPLSYVQYHLAPNMPTNFCALGDSVMRVNPLFGQGCAKACLGASTLDAVLRQLSSRQDGPWLSSDFGKVFWDLHTSRIQSIWTSNKAMDYSYASTIPVRGEDHSYGAFGRWYRDQLIILCAQASTIIRDVDLLLISILQDTKVAEITWRVNMFLGVPTDTLLPSIVSKIVIGWTRRRMQGHWLQCSSKVKEWLSSIQS